MVTVREGRGLKTELIKFSLAHSFTPGKEGGGSADDDYSDGEDDSQHCSVDSKPVFDEEN